MTSLTTIYFVFLKVGALLLGGGYVILPLLREEVVEKRKWITQEELIDFYSLSQCLPGIIAANVSIFTGCKIRGIIGAIAAITGVITAPFVAIVLLATALTKFAQIPVVINAFWGIAVGVVILIYLTVKEFFPISMTDKFTFIIFFAVFVAIAGFGASPAIIMICAATAGILYKKFLIKAGKE